MSANTVRTITLDVMILGREFKFACKENEREELTEAVAMLDRRMREIRDGGKVSGTDRIAVMAALNIAHDLLRERRASTVAGGATAQDRRSCSSGRRGPLRNACSVCVSWFHPLRCSIRPYVL
jgi:cell division protein ZapA (FtsZ GTPase activity inhibitor)